MHVADAELSEAHRKTLVATAAKEAAETLCRKWQSKCSRQRTAMNAAADRYVETKTQPVESNRELMSKGEALCQGLGVTLMENTGLRKRIHDIEGHNQYFFRCESAWCHPSEGTNPALDNVRGAIERSTVTEEENTKLRASVEELRQTLGRTTMETGWMDAKKIPPPKDERVAVVYIPERGPEHAYMEFVEFSDLSSGIRPRDISFWRKLAFPEVSTHATATPWSESYRVEGGWMARPGSVCASFPKVNREIAATSAKEWVAACSPGELSRRWANVVMTQKRDLLVLHFETPPSETASA